MALKILIKKTLFIFILSITFSCSNATEEEFQPPEFESFVDGKEDTGYVSNKAAELEAKLTTKVFIDMSGRTQEEIQSEADRLRNASRWTLQDYTTPQIKFARNALKSEKLDLNLEMGEPHVIDIQTQSDGIWLNYSLAIESLVKLKELEAKGLGPQDLIGKTVNFLLPAIPSQAFTKGGIACAVDPDGGTLDPSEVTEENYFYYFAPQKEGCPLKEGVELVPATYEVISSLDTPSVYPEYDLLTADRKITMVALFGQIEHGELKSSDWGWTAYRDFLGKFKRNGFSTSQTFPNNFGEQVQKTYPGGLQVIVDMYAPEALKDQRDRTEVNALFTDVIKNHEIVYYNGHSFYGSLSVLNNRDAYPLNTYQIIFMDSCWSYAYYTKQVFASKSGPDDPDGMKYADVVNNTEPGITGSQETAFLLYKNIFEGASKLLSGEPPTKYSWNNLIQYMNESADARARWYDPEKFHAEIYGASGVAKNCFNPIGSSRCNTSQEPSNRIYEDNSGESPIPDNNPSGISKTINVPDSFTVQGVSISIDISHTYIGDLVVSISHNGVEAVLHNRQGGGTDDIKTTFSPAEFNGMNAQGEWTLKVADFALYDTGSLKKWNISFSTGSTPSSPPITLENTQQQPIPDNQEIGVTSIIDFTENVIANQVKVHVKIDHTYIGDLIVVLQHDGIEAVLHNREGGSSVNIDSDFFPSGWNGKSATGEWKLIVSDRAPQDTGTLISWSITVQP